MDRANQFREAAAQENRGRRKAGWRYSDELKSLAVEHVRDRRQSGSTWAEIAKELGVSALSLGRWLEARPRAHFHPVEVIPDSEPARVVGSLAAVTPGGLRIEGLAWSQVLDLARVFR